MDNKNKQSDHHKPSRVYTITAKRAVGPTSMTTTATVPCGACKFLRRKCVAGCIFAPHFGSDQGGARFAAVHKVFGASNVSKLLQHVPVASRHDAVVTICYEAQARLADPVYGCVSTILSLQHQVASLQAELSMVQLHLINSKLAVASALHGGAQHNTVLQPAYSNTSAASNNDNMVNLTSCFPTSASFDLSDSGLPSSRGGGFEALQLSQPPSSSSQDEDEEESQNPVAVAFANGVFNPPK